MKRIGIIGTGGIAHAHAKGLEELTDRAAVTALCDINDDNLAKMAKRFPEAKQYKDWKELLAGPVDAVINCLPHNLHAPCIKDAAAAGKHVLCEKPLCTNLDEAEEIRKAVDKAGITLMCAHNQLFTPAVDRAKKELMNGIVGDVWAVRTADSFSMVRPNKADWGWRGDFATMGGGELIDTGYHPSYMLMYLADAVPASVTAMTDKLSPSGLDGEDTAEVLVRFKNGVRGTILTGWAFDLPAGFWTIHVIGSKGQLYGKGSELHFRPTSWPEPATMTFPEKHNFIPQAEHFISCLETGARPRHNHEDGIAVLHIILGAYESVKAGKVMEF